MTWYINGCPVTYPEYEYYMKTFESERWKKIQENKRKLMKSCKEKK